MPSNIVISLADKTGKTVAEVESKWEEAKKIVKKKTSENDDKYWPTVVSVVKSMLHVNEDIYSDLSYMESKNKGYYRDDFSKEEIEKALLRIYKENPGEGKTFLDAVNKWAKDDFYKQHLISKKFLNEEATVSSATTTSDIATVPKRLGDKPIKQASIDGELNGFPYFEIKEVGDYLKLASAKRMNKKLDISDQRIHDHVKTKGGPFLVKHGNNVLKLTKKDIYG